MTILVLVLVGLVALLHTWFLVLEMFLWTAPAGRATFGLDADFAERSKSLAANQGLYNGFLVAGLVWGMVSLDRTVLLFFLGCVVVAGAVGAPTVNKRNQLVQALPAVVAAAAVIARG